MNRLLIGCLAAALSVSSLVAQEGIREHFSKAQKYQSAGETTLAESEYRTALGQALEQLGALLTDQRRYDDALRAYSEAAEARANSDGALIGQAIVYLLQKKADPGIQAVEKVLARSPENAQARHLLGKLYMLAGRFKEAVGELEFAVARDPADLGAAYTLAMVYLEDKQLAPVHKIFNRLVQMLGDSAELQILIGKAFKEMSYLDEAAACFQKAIELNPKAPRAQFYLGQTYLIREGKARIPEAIELFRRELAIQPADFSANFLLGVACRETRRFPEAVSALSKAVRANPASPDAFHYLGSSFYSSGQYAAALRALQKAVALTTDVSRSDFQVSNTHYLLSQVYRKLGRNADAEKELKISSELKDKSARAGSDSLEAFLKSDSSAKDSALSMAGKDARGTVTLEIDLPSRIEARKAQPLESELVGSVATVYNALGLVRASLNDHARAAALFERALKWKEELRDLRYNLALTYFLLKSFDRAVPLLEKERAAKPAGIPVQHMLALCYFYTADFARAVPLIRAVLQARPQDPELNTALAISLLRTGDARGAEKIVRPLVEKNPPQPAMHLLLGQALAQQTLYAEASAMFRQALKLDPRLAEANYYLGMALLRGGQFDEAQAAFQDELQIRPNDAKSHYHLGYLMLMKHRVDDGLGELNKAVELEPGYAEAHYQLGKSYLQAGKLDQAKASLETAVRLDPKKDYIHYQLAQVYRRLGRDAEADSELSTYRSLKAQRRSPAEGMKSGEPEKQFP
ncbi:MAG TPA: tetratricopeptide repeat protein [Acidobacteriota bacterium]|jgi:tetratricopeptide (TPR) repeat protein